MLKNGNWFAVTVGIHLHSKCRGRVDDIVGDARHGEVVDQQAQPEHRGGAREPQPARPGQLEVGGLEPRHLVDTSQHLEHTPGSLHTDQRHYQ